LLLYLKTSNRGLEKIEVAHLSRSSSLGITARLTNPTVAVPVTGVVVEVVTQEILPRVVTEVEVVLVIVKEDVVVVEDVEALEDEVVSVDVVEGGELSTSLMVRQPPL